MGLHDYGHVNAPQRSNTRNYRVVTMNKMAVVIQCEKSTADFQAVLLFTSILKPIQRDPLLLERYQGGTRRPLDSEGRHECGKCRLHVFVLYGGVNDCYTRHVACVGLNSFKNNFTLELGCTKGEIICIPNENTQVVTCQDSAECNCPGHGLL